MEWRAAPAFTVNQVVSGQQGLFGVDVAVDDNDNFLVVWSGEDIDGDGRGVAARRVASVPGNFGNFLGDEFQVNTYTTGNQGRYSGAKVAHDSQNDDFVVTWAGGSDQDGSEYGVFAQRLTSSGSRIGTEFQVNSYTTAAQGATSGTVGGLGIASGGDGEFRCCLAELDARRRCQRHFRPAFGRVIEAMHRAWVLLLVMLVVGLAAPIWASEISERSYSVGLAELHGGRSTDGAPLESFERAVQSDPDDPYARYYLGVAQSVAGDLEAAVRELQEALRLKPDFAVAAADLGVVLLRSGRTAEAIPLLEAAARHADMRARSKLVLGVAQLRLGETDAAIGSFRTAAILDPGIALTARYYEGVAEWRRDRKEVARKQFRWVVSESPDSVFGREAARFLGSARVSEQRSYSASIAVGIDYDSNVTLETDGQTARGDETLPDSGDANFHLRAAGRYLVWHRADTAVTVGYEFFQRLYFDLDEYNLQGHRPDIRLTHRWRNLRFGVAAGYDYFSLDLKSYLQRATALPWVAIHQSDWGRSELSYRVRWNVFFRRPPGGGAAVDPDGELADDVLDSVTHRPILRQYLYIDGSENFVSLGYVFERREPIGGGDERFAFDSHGVEIGGGWLLPAGVRARASYAFQREGYDRDGRVDRPHLIRLALSRFLSDNLGATVAYQGLVQDSNQFEYDRHIASLSLEYVF